MEGSIPQFYTNRWYRTLQRAYNPTPDQPEYGQHGYLGFWFKDITNGLWYYAGSFDMGCPVTALSGFGRWTTLEWLGGIAAIESRIDTSLCYGRVGTQWYKMNKVDPAANRAVLENNTVDRLGNPLEATAIATTAYLDMPDQPPFDPIVINNAVATGYGNQVWITWEIPSNSSPQFGHKIELFDGPNATGNLLLTNSQNAPFIYGRRLTASAPVQSVRLTVIDVMDKTQSVVLPVPTGTLAPAVSSGGSVMPGLRFELYTGGWSSLPDFTGLTPARQGYVANLTTKPGADLNVGTCAYRYFGYLNAPADGMYMLQLGTRDGFKLSIDGTVVKTDDGVHPAVLNAIPLALSQGKHRFQLDYIGTPGVTNRADTICQDFRWAGLGFELQPVANGAFSCDDPGGVPTLTLSVASPVVTNGTIADNQAEVHVAVANIGTHTVKEIGLYGANLCVKYTNALVGGEAVFNVLLPKGTNTYTARMVCDNGAGYYETRGDFTLTVQERHDTGPWTFDHDDWGSSFTLPGSSRYADGTVSFMGQGESRGYQTVTGDTYTITGYMADSFTTDVYPTTPDTHLGLFGNSGAGDYRFFHMSQGDWRTCPNFYDFGGGTISQPLPNSATMKSNRWMRLTQNGKRCAAYSSADGTNWVKLSDWLGENFASGTHRVGSFFTGAVRDDSQKPSGYGKVTNLTVDTGNAVVDPAPPQPLAAELVLSNRITGVVQCINAPDTMYARSPTRGVLRSTDRGNTWREINTGLTDNPVAMAARSVAVHPTQPNIVLRAGGTLVNGALQSGLWRSTDAGNSWTLITTNIDFDGTGPTTLFGEVVMFSRTWTSTVIAAGESKMALSSDAGLTWTITPNACGGQRMTTVCFGPYSRVPPDPDSYFIGTFADSQLMALGLPAPRVTVQNPGSGGVIGGNVLGAQQVRLSVPDLGVATVHEGSYDTMIDTATTRGEYYTGFGPFPLNMAIPWNQLYVALSDEDYRWKTPSSPFLIRTAPFSSLNDNRIYQGIDRSEWTANWAALGDATTGSRLYHAPAGAYVCHGLTSIKCDSQVPNIVFFCNTYGIFKSTDSGANFTLMSHSEPGTGGTETYPFAAGSATPTSGSAPFTVTFDGSASYDDNGIVSYLWDFGDGTTGSGMTTTHVYTRGGTYNPLLTVTDTVGQQSSSTLPDIVVTGTYDLLSFTWGNTAGVISGSSVTLVVPYGTNLTNLNPACAVSSGATVAPASGSSNNFTTPVNYTVTAADGISKNVYSVTVYVAPPPGQIRTVPPGLHGGDTYRLAFVTSGETYGWSGASAGAFTTIAQYNNFAATAATAAPALNALGTTWKAVVATYAGGTVTSAPANTLTRATDPSVPIYNLDGALVARGNSDLWDGSISSPIGRTETGTAPAAQRNGDFLVWTGMSDSAGNGSGDWSLITPSGGYIRAGKPTAIDGTWASAYGSGDPNAYKSDAMPIYVISGTLMVPRTDCNLLTFQWGSYIATISGTSVALTVPYGTNLVTLNPTCTLSPYATVSPASGSASNFTSPVDYTVTAQDGVHSQVYHVTASVAPPSTACDLLTFQWGSNIATITGTNVALSVPFGTDVAHLNPTCTVSPLATVSPVSGVSGNFTSAVNYTVTAQDGTHSKIYHVTVTVTPGSSACDMLTFNLGSNNAAISGTGVTLTVPFGTNVTSLSPTCTMSPYATVSPASGSTRNFGSPVPYTVTAQDGTTTKTYTVTVIVAPDPNQIITMPSGLSPGSQYRLVFVTNTEMYGRANAGGGTGPTGINDFNTFATTTASAVPKLSSLGTTWKAVVSVRNANGSTVDAKSNTGTGSGTGVPIYNLGGLLVAANNTQLWGSALTNPINVTELGGSPAAQRDGYFMVHSGMTDNGGASGDWSLCYPSGGYVFAGNPTSTAINLTDNSPPSWCSQFGQADPNAYSYDQMPIYVMSDVLTVPTAPQISTFTWGSSSGVIDQTAKTISLTVPYGTNLATLNPTCTLTQGATASPASGAVPSPSFGTQNPLTYTVSAGGLQTNYTVTVTVTPVSTACDLLTLTWGSYSATISGTNATLALTNGTDVTALNPTCTVSPFATIAPASGTTRNFTYPQTYTVTAQNGTTSKTYTVTVIVRPVVVPPGLSVGDKYRLAFVTSGTTYGNVRDNASITDIGYFNTFGANAAAAVPALNALATTWKAVVSTNSTTNVQTDAKANTLTRTSDADAPIYNLDGLRVASGNAALWANALDNPINVTELGGGPPTDPRVHTGTMSGGAGWYTDGCLANPNGSYVGWGYANSTTVTWVYENRGPDLLRPIYVMSGVLTVPTPSNSYTAWAAANGASTDPAADSNHNGIPNGVEHFMGATAANPATMPAVVNSNGVLTWTLPYDPTAAASYKFQLSDNMSAWTDVVPTDSLVSVLTNPSRVRITLPAGGARKFCRLVVTPTP